MKLSLRRNGRHGRLTVTREEGDPKYYDDGAFLHAVKKKLLADGHDVIKKRMWKDGHLVNDDQQYIRTRSRRPDPDAFMIWWEFHPYRGPQDDWNKNGEVELAIDFDIFGA